jgi:hypothetical protein
MVTEARAVLWGVGQFEAADGSRVPWEISSDEMGRDMAAAGRALTRIGVGAGDHVLWCSMLSEAGQFWPFLVATMVAGAQLSCTDATAADATRLAMFCRNLRYRAVLGVNGALLDGLDELGLAPSAVLGQVGVVGARPDAVDRLRAGGLQPHHFVLIGPAVAIADQPGGPARADTDEWSLDRDGGDIVVSAQRERATAFDRTPTAVRGEIVDGGVIPVTTRRKA